MNMFIVILSVYLYCLCICARAQKYSFFSKSPKISANNWK